MLAERIKETLKEMLHHKNLTTMSISKLFSKISVSFHSDIDIRTGERLDFLDHCVNSNNATLL